MTRDRARKKSVREQMAASGEPYSVAARKLGRAAAAGEAARDEVITRLAATLAVPSARIEVRKVVTVGPAPEPVRDGRRRGPFRRLADVAVRGGWDHVVPEQARTQSDSTLGIIEPSARRFQYLVFKQHHSALTHIALGLEAGPAPSPSGIPGEDPLDLLMRLRRATEARYAGEATIREARCRKITVTDGTPGALTVWVDDEHVRQIQAATSQTAKRIAVTVVATTMVTAQLWDFGVPVDSMDWRRPSALWSELARRLPGPDQAEGQRFANRGGAERPDRHRPDLDRRRARIAEAEREGWFGEVAGLQVSLAGADDKLTQITASLRLRLPASPPELPSASATP